MWMGRILAYLYDHHTRHEDGGDDEISVAGLAGVGAAVTTGSYTGNETARQITTGFKCSMVIVLSAEDANGSTAASWILLPSLTIRHSSGSTNDQANRLWLHATDGFSVSTATWGNDTGSTYYYWAIIAE